MKISLVAAMDVNRVIGANNDMPWHLPADMKRFRSVTLGKPVVMGRRTYESIGKPLPQRENVVLTRDTSFDAPGCLVFKELSAVFETFAKREVAELVIIGGGEIYAQAMPQAGHLYLTRIDAELNGDTWFPDFDERNWTKVSVETHDRDERNAYNLTFEHWQRTQLDC